MQAYRPVVLAILDGWGCAEHSSSNAIAMARTPNIDRLMQDYPCTSLPAHGREVGLPEGQMGGSEVGHLCLGAGRIVLQDLSYLDHLIKTGEFQRNEVFLEAMNKAARSGRALHLMGLVSPGGVHSHQDHIYTLIEMARDAGVKDVYIHAFLDGRDVPPASALDYLDDLDVNLKRLELGKVATVSGRYYAMDRDNRWDRIRLAWDAMVHSMGPTAESAQDVVKASYDAHITDEFVVPTVIVDEYGAPVGPVCEGDSVIFFNFRGDRARQLTKAFNFDDFSEFNRGTRPHVNYVCMMKYLDADIPVAFSPPEPVDGLSETISKAGRTQLHVAETEKFAHVTFFFNGGREEPFPNEERALIPSPKVATYDLEPEMSARKIAAEVISRVESGKYDFIVVNFANGDMVGHTGKLDATIVAVETVDDCVGRVWEAIRKADGALIVTSDHGNADQMLDVETGQPSTAHSLNKVPFILVGTEAKKLRDDGTFADVAPTVLELMGLQPSAAMTGRSLIAGYGE